MAGVPNGNGASTQLHFVIYAQIFPVSNQANFMMQVRPKRLWQDEIESWKGIYFEGLEMWRFLKG